jgi:maltose phosphorylase
MKDYLVKDEWKIIEDQFHPEYNQISESIFSLGNGQMGQRANMEECFSGETLPGNYIAGVYYPDKTKVGWWKNGYPEYFAKVLNAVNWVGLNVVINGHEIDLGNSERVHQFYRELDMKRGLLTRKVIYTLDQGAVEIVSRRFCSMANNELGALEYTIKPLGVAASISVLSYLDFDVINQDSNYEEKFWIEKEQTAKNTYAQVSAETMKTGFLCSASMTNQFYLDNNRASSEVKLTTRSKYAAQEYSFFLEDGKSLTLEKTAVIASSRNHSKTELSQHTIDLILEARKSRFDELLAAHVQSWAKIWNMCDIHIGGDVSAQQGIRFNIFQLYQTYTGDDDRLNIGPKGFTGEKYGGSTYWDTEAYCLPFYLGTADPAVARSLLVYRYKHLGKAIENAEKLGFSNGAALYPMVTMNGEECHNEWEITFEEIHRNGAMSYAIYDYINYTGDKNYLAEYGLEVLIAIARFWAQRVHLSPARNEYVMLGVTGPNEYENNVDNNWYTSYLAKWCLEYAASCIDFVKLNHPKRWEEISEKINWSEEERTHWEDIQSRMYLPEDKERGIVLQQSGFLDKEDITCADLRPEDRPLNQNWSWDRILRSPFIKQADVLQGMYFFEDRFDLEEIRRNYLYYEPKTVHESSLSPCVHSILACSLGMKEKAYEMYLRTSRLDLDDYNNDTEDGCHITSMAGTWLSIIKGFAGQRIKNGMLSFRSFLPEQWDSIAFKMLFRGVLLHVKITHDGVEVENTGDSSLELMVNGELMSV